ncbi:hypothetical protein ACH5TX_00170, partial [Flavobacteriaceae bacterium MEBiC06459]
KGDTGEQGADGGGVTVQGSDTLANIFLKDNTVPGLMWIALDSGTDQGGNAVAIGDGLVSNGTQWITVGQIRGPQGPKGDKGDTGDQGIQGIQGVAGLDGVDGATGPKGDKGDTGEQGADGGGVTVQGSDTLANIFLKDNTVPGLMWIALDSGTDQG